MSYCRILYYKLPRYTPYVSFLSSGSAAMGNVSFIGDLRRSNRQ